MAAMPFLGSAAMWMVHGCGSDGGPKPIRYGRDQCAHCRMTVSDARFGAQLVTTKGRAYNFDDLNCMMAAVKKNEIAETEVAAFYLPDYLDGNELLPAEGLFLLHSEQLKSPMLGNTAAFRNLADLAEIQRQIGGELVEWKELW